MDVSNGSADESVMIALLPTSADWCRIDLPHLTLVYAGLKKDLNPTAFNDLAKDCAMLSMLTSPLSLSVMDKEIFGDTEKVDVLRFQATSELLAMRRAVEKWNKSEFPFNPHSTIGPVGTFIDMVPTQVRFDRIMVAWGEEQLTFWLRR
jgi:2'-5' RNA ligase